MTCPSLAVSVHAGQAISRAVDQRVNLTLADRPCQQGRDRLGNPVECTGSALRNLPVFAGDKEEGRRLDDLWQGLMQAFWLVVTLDADLVEISLRSLQVTLSALALACLVAMPLAALLTVRRFRLRRSVIAVMNALMGLPPVVVGLVVYVLLSRSGPLGALGLLFTPWAMIIAQMIVIIPLIASISHQSLRDLWFEYHDLLISMNVTRWQKITTLLWDARRALLTAALAGFGRGIGEVGAIMIVGGNIDHATRVLTTAIALETGKGDFALALALGFILIALAIAVNLVIHWLGRTEREGRW